MARQEAYMAVATAFAVAFAPAAHSSLLDAMRSLVEIFHRNGGSVIQFTVFSAEELKDAQLHPEKYENLQVRICGWNVRWNDLCKSEQDAYIRRAENVMKGY